MLSEEAVAEYIKIFEKQTGGKLSEQEGVQKANVIFALFKAIVKPIARDTQTLSTKQSETQKV